MYDALAKALGEDLLQYVVFKEPYGEILDSPFVIETNLNILTAENARKVYDRTYSITKDMRESRNADILAYLNHYLPNHKIKGYYDFIKERTIDVGAHINNLHTLWLEQNETHKYHKEWNELFRKEVGGYPGRTDPAGVALAGQESRRIYNDSRDLVLLYRGQDTIKDINRGLAWTTSKEKAEEFAAKCRNGMVATLTVHKDAIYTFLDRGDYIEAILLDPAFAIVRRPHLMIKPSSVRNEPLTSIEPSLKSRERVLTEEELQKFLEVKRDEENRKIELEAEQAKLFEEVHAADKRSIREQLEAMQEPGVLYANLDTNWVDPRASSESVGFKDSLSGKEVNANVVAPDALKEWIKEMAEADVSGLFNNTDVNNTVSFLSHLIGGFKPGTGKGDPERKDPTP